MDCAACEQEDVIPLADCPKGPSDHETESVEWVLSQDPSTEAAAWQLAHDATGSVGTADHASAAFMDEEKHRGGS